MYLEDIQPGQRAAFGSYQVTREDVLAFAAKYDPQPFHLSDEGAQGTHFGRLAASGWHTTAMTMAMVVANMGDSEGSLGAAGIDELRWLKPVYPGDTLRCETEVLEVTPSRSRPNMGSVRTRLTVLNQHNDPVMRFISIGLVRRRG